MPKVNRALQLPDPPPPEVWDSAIRTAPVLTGPDPELISDGGGLPFTIAAAYGSPEQLDPSDPRVKSLLRQIDLGRQLAMPRRILMPRAKPPAMTAEEKLADWRVLAETDDDILYGRGTPPQLLTVAVQRLGKERWQPLGASNARPLRAYKGGARASLWRIDPNFLPSPGDTEVRVLLTEISKATGTMPTDRLLAPELHVDEESFTVRFFVKPLDGYVGGTRRHETPVILELPEPLGSRVLRDGGVYRPTAPAD